jgi:hypothetical protein
VEQRLGQEAKPRLVAPARNMRSIPSRHGRRTAGINPDAMNGTPTPTPQSVPFKDRRTGLIVFGIVEMILGALVALLIPLMILGQVMAAQTGQPGVSPRQMIPGVVVYGILAAMLITLGIGSCKTRRWARALSLVLAWSWFSVGVITLAVMAFILPSILANPLPQGQALPESARLAVMIFSLIFMGIIMVVVPGVLVFFYQSRHVKATCDARDPSRRWTDACPLPVVALSLWLWLGAVSMLMMPWSTNGVLPVFGRLLSGIGGSLCYVGLALLWGYSAWSVYRLRIIGWWITLIVICVGAVSASITFMHIELPEMYRTMGYPDQQIEMMKQFSFMQGRHIVYFTVAGAVLMIGFLAFVKRHFSARHKSPDPLPGS